MSAGSVHPAAPAKTVRLKSALAALHAAVLLFGLAGLFGKLIEAPPTTIVLGRTCLAALALGLFLLMSDSGKRAGLKKEGPLLAVQGAILALHWWTFFHAIQISSVAVGLLGFAAFPMFVTLLEPLLFKESYRWFDIVISAAVSIGLTIVAWPFESGSDRVAGVLWGATSGLLFAVLSLLNRRSVRMLSPVAIACLQNAFAFLVLLPTIVWSPWKATWSQIGLLILLGVLCTAVAHALFIYSLRRVKTQLAGIMAALEPVYGIIFALLLLSEKPSLTTLAGGTLIISAAAAAIGKAR